MPFYLAKMLMGKQPRITQHGTAIEGHITKRVYLLLWLYPRAHKKIPLVLALESRNFTGIV